MRSGNRQNIDDVKWPNNLGCNGIQQKTKNEKLYANKKITKNKNNK
jgi:hypothetical protein